MREFGFEHKRLTNGSASCETMSACSAPLNEACKEGRHGAFTGQWDDGAALHGEESIAKIAQPWNNIATSC